MFKCQFCWNKTSEPEQICQLVVTERRLKNYLSVALPYEPGVFGAKKFSNSGTGWEIVREAECCPSCVKIYLQSGVFTQEGSVIFNRAGLVLPTPVVVNPPEVVKA